MPSMTNSPLRNIGFLWRTKGAKPLTKLEVTEDGTSVLDQLRNILTDKKTGARLCAQLKAWDDTRDGYASRKEFRRGVRYLGYEVSIDVLNAMWDEIVEGKKHGEVKFDALKAALLRLGSGPPAEATSDAATPSPAPLAIAAAPAPTPALATAAAAAPKAAKKRVLIGATPARVAPAARAAPAEPVRPPSRAAPLTAFSGNSTISPAMKRAIGSVSPAIVRASAYTAVTTLATVSPAMVRAAHGAVTLAPLASPMSMGKRGPLSAKSGANLDRWTRLALEEMNEVNF
jgi:hypothetical protein